MNRHNRNRLARLGTTRRRRRGDERGATILEFAFVLVITFVLIFAIIDFARALYSYHFISEAAREGSRYGAVRGAGCNPTAVPSCPADLSALQTDIQNYVNQLIPAGIDSSKVGVIPAFPGGNLSSCGTGGLPVAGCPVNVVVQYQFNFIFPASFYNLPPISYLPSSINMQSTSQVNVSR